jgi:hypothetical protein
VRGLVFKERFQANHRLREKQALHRMAATVCGKSMWALMDKHWLFAKDTRSATCTQVCVCVCVCVCV